MQSTANMRTLVADDDPVFLNLVTATLRPHKIDVVTAADGGDAMALLHETRIDVAIIDIIMPQIDGWRLVAMIRATPRLKDLPVIIVTSQENPKLQTEAQDLGANDFIYKPVDWSTFAQRVIGMGKLQKPHDFYGPKASVYREIRNACL